MPHAHAHNIDPCGPAGPGSAGRWPDPGSAVRPQQQKAVIEDVLRRDESFATSPGRGAATTA